MKRSRRLVSARLGALVLASVAALGSVTPARACTTVGGVTQEEHLAAADVVFTGTVVRLDDPSNGMSDSSLDPLSWTFVVDGVVKGDVPDRITVASAMAEASCGYTFVLGRRYQVYASDSVYYGRPATGLGDGNMPLPALADPPPVEGEFHTVFYQVMHVGPYVLPVVFLLVLLGMVWWYRRSPRPRGSATT